MQICWLYRYLLTILLTILLIDNKIRKISANIVANSFVLNAGNSSLLTNVSTSLMTFMKFQYINVVKLNTSQVLSLSDFKSVITSMQSKTCEC